MKVCNKQWSLSRRRGKGRDRRDRRREEGGERKSKRDRKTDSMAGL